MNVVNITTANITATINSATFSLTLAQILEEDVNHVMVQSFNVSNAEFALNVQNQTTGTFWNFSAVHNFGSAPEVQTVIQIYINYFAIPTSVTFAGTALAMPANSFKMALFISDWPFRSSQNSMRVVFSNTGAGGSDGACSSNGYNDQNGSLQWVQLIVNGVSMFSQLLGYALVDGTKRYVEFGLYETSYISASIPFFWYNVSLDPTFGFLLDSSNGCGIQSGLAGVGMSWEVYLAIPLGILALGFLGGVVYYFRVRDWWKGMHKKVEVEMDD